MKKTPSFVMAIAVTMALAAIEFPAVDLRADDQVPPVPPGNSLPPTAPATTPTPPSTSPALQTSGGTKRQAAGEGKRRFEKLKQELGLTPAQVARIKPIFERTAEQVKTLRSSVSLSAAQKKQQIRQIVASSFQQIRPVLTPQQLQKWKQIREEHRGQTQTAST